MKFSRQFEEALIYATRAHGNQTRKKTGIPFIAHILGVTAIALEYGANETEAIGALLHDTVEDCGGAERLRDIRKKFGDDVGRIVDGCTDTDQTPKPPWLERKRAYLEHLKDSDSSTRLVSASDKLQHARDPGCPSKKWSGSVRAVCREKGWDALVLPGAGHRVSAAWRPCRSHRRARPGGE